MARTAPETARRNFQRGLSKHEEGLSGDGLESATVRQARRLASGESASDAWIRKANAWWGRNERFLQEDADSPAYVSALLWGGAAGRDWVRSEYNNLKSMAGAAKDYSTGDPVTWQSSGGTASGVVRRVVTDGSVSPSTTAQSYEGTEDRPAYLIELLDDDGEPRDETVVHFGGALSKKMHSASDLLIAWGSSVKDLSDTGRFGGYLVRFMDETTTDFDGEFFTPDTKFWLDGEEGTTHTLWAHGMDPVMGHRHLTPQKARLVKMDAGVWMEAQMQARDEYEAAVLHLMGEGRLGMSSGTASHLVEKTRTDSGAVRIDQWPLELDGSVTPTPSEPSTTVQLASTKSFPTLTELMEGTPDRATEQQFLKSLDAAMQPLDERDAAQALLDVFSL